MRTILQYLWLVRDHLKIYIGSKTRLLLTAVVLFSLSWTIFSPVRGLEQLIFNFNPSNGEQAADELIEDSQSNAKVNIIDNKPYLTANILASLVSDQSNSLDQSVKEDQLFEIETALPTLDQEALLSQNGPITTISQEPRSEIITYVVKQGDSPSEIAASFGITVYTLLWANKLTETSIIRPGDELVVLPVSGVVHQVKDGQTVETIAKIYRAETDDILAFNDLPADGAIQVGQKLIVPDGQMPTPPKPKAKPLASTDVYGPGTGKSRVFPWGQCTWYVAQKRYIPWSGHAKYWLANASQYGFQTGSAPQVGAIMVTRENGWYGHVAYVEAINGPWITISEMNYVGRGIKSVRTLHQDSLVIRGYVY